MIRWVLLVALLMLAAAPLQAFERRTPVVEAVAKAGPAVVNVRTEQLVRRRSAFGFGFGESLFDEFFRNFGPQQTYTTQSLGSGVIIDPAGYILTNAHVVEQGTRIFVALAGRPREVEATLVGQDARVDLAVLKVAASEALPALKPGRSDDLLPGETVIAIGNPLGLEYSVTTGVVSAPRRRLALEGDGVAPFIQTDALINPGNSGGPLLNINGELIGINTAIASQAQGIGFAIPAEVAGRVAGELIAHGALRPAWFGIVPGIVGDAWRRERGSGGVLVGEVEADSPAAAGGVHSSDVIVAVDGVAVDDRDDFFSLLSSHVIGDAVQLRVVRESGEEALTVRLVALPDGYVAGYLERNFGLRLAEDERGVAIDAVRGATSAERVGLRRGDRLLEIAGVGITRFADVERAVAPRLGHFPLRVAVARGNRGYYLDLQ